MLYLKCGTTIYRLDNVVCIGVETGLNYRGIETSYIVLTYEHNSRYYLDFKRDDVYYPDARDKEYINKLYEHIVNCMQNYNLKGCFNGIIDITDKSIDKSLL